MCEQIGRDKEGNGSNVTAHDEDYESATAEPAKPPRPKDPLAEASPISQFLFMWPYPLLKLGMKRALEESDLPEISEADTSAANRIYFEKLWEEEKRQNPNNPRLDRAILKDFVKSMWYVQPMYMLAAVAKVSQAVALGLLIEAFEDDNGQGYLWATVIVMGSLALLAEHHHSFFFTWRKGMRLRIAAIASIYYKSQRLSSTHQDTSANYGQIMNLASNDVERFMLAALFCSHLIWAPLQCIAILCVGWVLLGPAFAAGVALLVVGFIPLQMYLSRRFVHFRGRIAAITDTRVNFVSQAVYGARVMKMSGFEWRFLDRIQDYRAKEVDQIVRANRLKAWNEALFFCANVVISVVIFLVHVASGETLTPRDVFTTFTLVNIIQIEMTKHLSLGVMGVSEAFVSLKRIQNFLEFPELPYATSQTIERASSNSKQHGDCCLSLKSVNCNWNDVETVQAKSDQSTVGSTEDMPALTDVSLDFNRGQLTCLVGAVGSGKSAMLQALVGELPVKSGVIGRNYSSLAYAAQDPWIMDGTVKENIMMGKDFDAEWYDRVVNSCSLNVDFKQLRDGDETVVGDRGVQISGGQRARIGLARALYKDADILVADDPLSAVDSKVGRQLFQEAIMNLSVNRGKCTVLATHQHQHIGDHRCVLIVAGRVAHIGSYEECVAASGGKLSAHAKDDSAVDNLDGGDDKSTMPPGVAKEEEHVAAESNLLDDANGDIEGKEIKQSGLVKLETYANYLRAMGGLWVGAAMLALFSITQASVLVTIGTVGRWAERPADQQNSWAILGLVIGLSSAVVILAVSRAMLSLELTVKASQRLHDRMAKSLLRAKIEFFDTNPMGRILNRVSADVGSNDDLLPQTLFDFCVIAFIVLGAVATTVTVLPFTLLAFPPLVWYFLSVRKTFVTSTRELKRLESLARSPIFAMLGESLGGIATIRSNQSLGYFRKKFEEAHDAHTRAFYAFIAASRWVGFRMDAIMFLFLTLVAYLSVLFQQEGWFDVDPAILGLSLSMLLQLAGLFQWCIRQSAEVVNQMVAVERVLEFGDLESEAPLELDGDEELTGKGWPSTGAVKCDGLAARYRPSLPLALNQISFEIPGGARVGVVGRTGSGKSTVVQTLFRLLEAEEGTLSIDGVDVSKLGLHALRTKISVIPQVPTLFSGCTVRENLDLFGCHSDAEIQSALDDAHLGDVVAALPKGWDSIVSEGGSNFSVGQRQLLCLARAILSNNRILVLDEATASVDRRTDEMLQDALQESFKEGTIIAVAHRLETIIDYDIVLVLGHGRVLEWGSPAKLLTDGGAFASMVNDTGDSMSAELRKRAFSQQKEQGGGDVEA
ncbi:Multiple drug resistance-associated protein-like transporter 1 [Seminavis robusta]|uniref:Multiple drug resistance-associated protein-like transporter 1 n=1 Tax=Seminavis robusta TaxID=568900 RepID=A0A9N8HCX2_9STRA|nr:Multiple drug resistance-associated protein-like transporter 1 [Seminavis robusta]|eukprot:Sro399_g134960.1 Multiple drug resistance-associated protein-like transporter 1 (1332) ;mRNA; r:58482-62736